MNYAVDLSAGLSHLDTDVRTLLARAVSTGEVPARTNVPILQQQRRIDKSEPTQLIRDHEAGQTVQQLAKAYNLHRTTVLDHLVRANIPRRPHVRKLTDQQVQRAAELYATGLSLAAVGKHFNVDAQTIRREFEKASIPVRPRRGQPPT